jgi:hypothetical protein
MTNNENQENNRRVFIPTSEIIATLDRELAYIHEINEFCRQIAANARKESRMDKVFRMLANPWVDGFLAGLLVGGIIFLLSTL